MASSTIRLTTAIATLVFVAVTEIACRVAVKQLPLSPMLWLGLLRLVQIGMVLWIVTQKEKSLAAIGWAVQSWPAGLKQGALWSMGFGLLAGAAMLMIRLWGHDPIALIRSPLPKADGELILYFFVGGFIAPVAEEICFRGILYTCFRRWGVALALVASTAIFVSLHASHGIPGPQIVGGLVFAVAYEISGNLMVPITIHALGNLAIFSLSLL